MTLTKIVFAEKLHTNGHHLIEKFETIWKVTTKLNNNTAKVFKIDPEMVLKQFIDTYFPQELNCEYDTAHKLHEERIKVLENKKSFINYIERAMKCITTDEKDPQESTLVVVTGVYDDELITYLKETHNFQIKYLTTSDEERMKNFKQEFEKQDLDRPDEDISTYIDLLDLNGDPLVKFNQDSHDLIELNSSVTLDKIALQLVLEFIS